MKKTDYLTSEPVEHLDPARLAFYVTWEKIYRKHMNGIEKSNQKWRFWLSAISLSLGLTIITFLIAA